VTRYFSDQQFCEHLIGAIRSSFVVEHSEAPTRTNYFTQLAHIDLPIFSGIMQASVAVSVDHSVGLTKVGRAILSGLHLSVFAARLL
jgi:hypothetical protein